MNDPCNDVALEGLNCNKKILVHETSTCRFVVRERLTRANITPTWARIYVLTIHTVRRSTLRLLVRYCVMSRVSTEFHANQRVKGNSSTRYQEVPGNHGHHCVRIVEQDNESNVRWRASEWHAKVSSG